MTLPNELVDSFCEPIPSRVRGPEAERRVRGGSNRELGEGGACGETGEPEAYVRITCVDIFDGTGGGGEGGGGGGGTEDETGWVCWKR